MNNAFIFYQSYFDQIETLKNLKPELVPQLYMAIVNYGIYEDYGEVDPLVEMAMTPIKQGIDAAHDRYEVAQESGRKGGQKRGQYDKRAIAEMAFNNPDMRTADIAEYFGCSTKTVNRAKKEFGDRIGTNVPGGQKEGQNQDNVPKNGTGTDNGTTVPKSGTNVSEFEF